MPLRSLPLSLSIALALVAPAVHAQGRPEPARDARGADDTALPQVTVTGEAEAAPARTDVSLEATALPTAVTTISREEITTINVSRDISNIFRRVPGVIANALDQGDTGNGFRMRGFATQGTHGADTAVYVDGVPQNMPSSEAGAGHGPAFLEWLTPDMIRRVEVIKGPVSALHGDQNRAGAVNLWTATGSEVSSSVAFAVESYNGRRGSLVHAAPMAGLDSLLIADVYRSDGYRQGAWLDRDNLFWKLSGQFGDGHYSLRANHYRSDFEAAGYLRYDRLAAARVDRSAAEEDALAPFGGGRRTGLVFNRSPAGGEAGWYATAYVEAFDRERGSSGGGLVHNVGSDDRSILGGRLASNLEFGPRAALLVGVDARRDRGEGLRQRFVDRVPTPLYVTALDMRLDTWGVFAQGQYRPIDALKLSAGLRADHFDYRIDNLKRPAASTDYRDDVLTPKLGAAWQVSPVLSLFANVAEGFRSPAAQQISPAGALGPLGEAGSLTNVDLSPSKVRSWDIGATADAGTGWTASAAFYRTLNEDEIVQVAPNVFASVGDTTRRGFELDARTRIGQAFAVYGSYARLLQAEINNPAPNSAFLLTLPRHQAKAGAEFLHALGAGTMRYNVDGYVTRGAPYFTGSPLRQQTVPTYTRYDVRASWDIGDWQFAAYAVLQPQLMSEAFFSTAAGLWVSTQPRRHVGLSARWYF